MFERYFSFFRTFRNIRVRWIWNICHIYRWFLWNKKNDDGILWHRWILVTDLRWTTDGHPRHTTYTKIFSSLFFFFGCHLHRFFIKNFLAFFVSDLHKKNLRTMTSLWISDDVIIFEVHMNLLLHFQLELYLG